MGMTYYGAEQTIFLRYAMDHTDEYNELLHAHMYNMRKLLWQLHVSQEDHEEYLYTIGGINKDEYI